MAEDYKGRRAEDYLAAVNRDCRNMEIWNGIPERLRTQRMQTAITQLLCSGAGHVNEVLFGQRGFPNRMLYTVMERGLISVIDEERKCFRRLDKFSEHFLSEYPDISTEEAQAVLESILLLAHGETIQVEKRHGDLRRFIHVRSVHTHMVELGRANEFFVAKTLDEQLHDYFAAKVKKVPAATLRKREQEAKREEEEAQAEPKRKGRKARKRKTKPVGVKRVGAYSALLSEMRQGKTGAARPTMEACSAEWKKRKMNPQQLEALNNRAARGVKAQVAGNLHPFRRASAAAHGGAEAMVPCGPETSLETPDPEALADLPLESLWDAVPVLKRSSRREATRAAEKHEDEKAEM